MLFFTNTTGNTVFTSVAANRNPNKRKHYIDSKAVKL